MSPRRAFFYGLAAGVAVSAAALAIYLAFMLNIFWCEGPAGSCWP